MSMTQSRTAVLKRSTSLVDDVSLVVIGSALMAVCAHISLPLLFSPVPLTLQTFGVLFIALTLGPKRGAAAMALYLMEGASGLPVFSPAGTGGIAQLMGPTGGFLMSYPLAAFVIGKLFETKKSVGMAQIASLAGVLVFLSAGVAWLMVVTHASLSQALTMAVLPFIPGEVIKVVAASYAAPRTRNWLSRLGI
jgi:biotin transport system substrate-specific component